jgi:ribosomal protein S18 acetylase RimI-like enzyme
VSSPPVDAGGPQASPGALRIEACGPDLAGIVHLLTQEAFRAYLGLDPPTGAAWETEETVRADLARSEGAVAWIDSRPVACIRLDQGEDHVHVRRLAVLPELQGHGIGRALMEWSETDARRRAAAEVTLGVRIALPGNRAFFERLGYEVVAEQAHPGYDHPTSFAMRKRLR